MKILVTYKSKTGFTKKYAEMIAEEIECSLVDFKAMTAEKMSDYDVVVFGSRLHAGMVDGLKKAKEMFAKSSAKKFVVFATGATPNEATEIVDGVWKNNLSEEELESVPHFYLQSGICYERMPFVDKTIMKMAASMMSKKQDKDEYEEGFEQALKGSFDISSKEYTKPLIDYLVEGLRM